MNPLNWFPHFDFLIGTARALAYSSETRCSHLSPATVLMLLIASTAVFEDCSNDFFKFRDYILNVQHSSMVSKDDATALRGKAARLWSKLIDVLKKE